MGKFVTSEDQFKNVVLERVIQKNINNYEDRSLKFINYVGETAVENIWSILALTLTFFLVQAILRKILGFTRSQKQEKMTVNDEYFKPLETKSQPIK